MKTVNCRIEGDSMSGFSKWTNEANKFQEEEDIIQHCYNVKLNMQV